MVWYVIHVEGRRRLDGFYLLKRMFHLYYRENNGHCTVPPVNGTIVQRNYAHCLAARVRPVRVRCACLWLCVVVRNR